MLTPEIVFRNYETAGVPDSGAHDPKKSEIIQLLNMLFGVSRGGWVVARTLTELNGIMPPSATDGGVVLSGVGAGYYDRDGSVWVFGRGFPDTFAKVGLSGSGTAQTGTVNTGVNPASIEVFFANVATPNTGTLTLSISDGPVRPVINLAGNPLSAGEWTGMVMFYLNDANQYQLLIDAGAAASAATSATSASANAASADEDADRAEAAAADAMVSKNAAQAASEASGSVVFYDTYALANADSGTLPDLQIVEVFADEGRGGERTRYRKVSGALVFKLRLSNKDLATKSGIETLTNKTLGGAQNIVTNADPVAISSEAATFVPDRAFVGIKNANHKQFSLRVRSEWEGGAGTPFNNNDGVLSEIYDKVLSNSANQTWAFSGANAYHNIPVGVTDSGMRVGVLGWAVSVKVAGYEHAGRLNQQFGVWGRAGFQGGGALQSPSTARITEAIGVRGEIATDTPTARIDVAKAGLFESVCASAQIDDSYAIYARASGATTKNYAFWGEAGKLFNRNAIETDGNFYAFSGLTTAQFFNNGTSAGIATNAARTAGQLMAIGGSTWSAISDQRIKSDVETVSVLDKLQQFRAVTYTNLLTGMSEFGVIAQEMAQCFPEFVVEGNQDPEHMPTGIDDPDMWKVTGSERMGAYALQGVKELLDMVRELKAEIASLRDGRE